ncbi:MAG: GNAT family N-acetyltransferase [Flavobacteriaceae bacterium]|nr:GNAT family N-acetyltransferase [Flavobacteriaceae bacterium]
MKIFRSESFVDYSTYTFNYALYCIKESQSEIPEIYNKGFLPYSNNTELQFETYYLARSLRVDLDRFQDSSENRRVEKKIIEIKPSFKVIPVSEFNINQAEFLDFCLDYGKNRFSEGLELDRLKYILATKSISHIFEFKIKNKIAGYVISIIENGTLHYWFSFFDLNYQKFSLGKYMMFNVIKWASENNLKYVYLGTCYGEKSLYKVRDFKGLSFYDGNQWNIDVKLLKQKCKSDQSFSTDYFKQDTDLFLERLDQ